MDSWITFQPQHAPKLWAIIASALKGGLFCYNFNLIESLWIGGTNSTLIFKIHQDTLCVARHSQIMGNRIVKLLFPPIPLNGDEERSAQVMRDLLRLGVTARVPKEYAVRHEFDHATESQWKGAHEIIYTRESLNLTGKKYSTERSEYNKLRRLISKGEIEVVTDLPLKSLTSLYSSWLEQQDYKEGIFSLFQKEKAELGPSHLKYLALRTGDGIIFCSLFLSLCEGVLINPCSMTDFRKSPVPSLQKTTALLLFEQDPSLQTILVGGYDAEGVKASKSAIPHEVIKQVRLKSPKKLSKEEWLAFKPQQENFFGV